MTQRQSYNSFTSNLYWSHLYAKQIDGRSLLFVIMGLKRHIEKLLTIKYVYFSVGTVVSLLSNYYHYFMDRRNKNFLYGFFYCITDLYVGILDLYISVRIFLLVVWVVWVFLKLTTPVRFMKVFFSLINNTVLNIIYIQIIRNRKTVFRNYYFLSYFRVQI